MGFWLHRLFLSSQLYLFIILVFNLLQTSYARKKQDKEGQGDALQFESVPLGLRSRPNLKITTRYKFVI
ncbi:MAG: hypothetical protein D3916_16860 [Candidatus Electrothrix sp. MAN1_4]|nr:hypothetical protein [Candidatus Electrothrix sp. MAN1_4]